MALLLKVKPDAYQRGSADVPAQKSKRLSNSDLGQRVFVGLDDSEHSNSALYCLCRLGNYEEIEMSQVRRPDRTKHRYRLTLCEEPLLLVAPLTTDDLKPFRDSSDSEGLGTLGCVHRDRNDKIFELSLAQERALMGRFAA